MSRYKLLMLFSLLSLVLGEDVSKCEQFNSAVLKYVFTGEMTKEHSQVGNLILYSGTFLSDLGDYAGCLSLDYGEYFRASIQMGDNLQFIGLCLYKECSASQVKLAKTELAQFLRRFVGDFSLDELDFTRPRHDDAEIKPSVSIGLYIVLPILVLFLLLNLFACIQARFYNSTNIFVKLFDPVSNLKSITKAFPYSNTSSLNGIRFLAMFGVVYGHSFFIVSRFGLVKNPSELRILLQSVTGAIIGTCLYAVDIFFFLSGFLFRINLPKNKLIKGKSSFAKKLLVPIILRYIRLLPIMLLSVFGFYYTLDSISNGALQDYSRSGCAEGIGSTWKLLFYLNNVLPTDCQGQSWYLANDMQFFIFSLLIILLVENKTAQDLVFGSLIAISFCVSFWLSYSNKFGYIQILFPEPQDDDFFDDYYIKPWTRVQPYLVGLIFANLYLGYEKDNKEEKLNETEEEEKTVYQRFNKWVCKSRTIQFIYISLGIALFLSPFIISYWVLNLDYRLNPLIAACLNSFVKFLNVGGLGIMVHMAFMGKFKVFDKIASCEVFSIFTKIGYSVYMFHLSIYLLFIMNTNIAFYVTNTDFFLFSVTVFGLSSLVGMAATVVYDSPVAKLVNLTLKGS